MKRFTILCWIISFLLPATALAVQSFLEVPIIPGAKIVEKTESKLELKVNKSHDEIVAFYKEVFKGLKDIRYREWKSSTYIEDDSNRPWHSVTIYKPVGDQASTTVVIKKDNWTWIITTLILRFIGVFVVLLVLFVGMSICGAILSRIFPSEAAENTSKAGK